MTNVVPFLWYSTQAEEAAKFYASLLPDSRVDYVTAMPADSPSGPAGTVKVVEFTLCGQPMMAMSAGPLDEFNHSISFMVLCDTQGEIDRFWSELSEGGETEDCGWVRDRFGLSWQIAPRKMQEWMRDPDREKARRVSEAMLTMQKLDLEALRTAAGETSA